MSKRFDLVIQKSDKGNFVVIVDKSADVTKIKELSDTSKFISITVPPDKELNSILSQERKVKSVLKDLLDRGKIDKAVFDKLCFTGSRFGDYMD